MALPVSFAPSISPSFWDIVAFSPHRPLTHSVGNNNNEVMTILPSLPEYWDYRCIKPCLVICGVGDRTQGFLHVKQTLPHYSALEKYFHPCVSVFMLGSKKSYRACSEQKFSSFNLSFCLFNDHIPWVECWGSPVLHFASERVETLLEKVSLKGP